MGNKVYVVTAGYYSDYHICNVYTTKEKAEEAVDFYKMQDPYYANTVDIEEYITDANPKDERDSLIYSVSMSFDKDGNAKEDTFRLWHIEYEHDRIEVVGKGGENTIMMTVESRKNESYKDFSKRCIKILIDEFYHMCGKTHL